MYHKQGPHADLHPEIQLHHEAHASRVKSPYEEQQEQQRLEAQRAEERRQIRMHQEALQAQRERVLREREQKLKEEREKEEQQHREADRQEQLLREEQQRSDGVIAGRNRVFDALNHVRHTSLHVLSPLLSGRGTSTRIWTTILFQERTAITRATRKVSRGALQRWANVYRDVLVAV